ncbi:MAG TPA: hypothetical protein PKY56_04175 [Candidatus Kapabacteria bacterium]|nr:hypothetical protein [Candidatus Kapabacteria bacterium]
MIIKDDCIEIDGEDYSFNFDYKIMKDKDKYYLYITKDNNMLLIKKFNNKEDAKILYLLLKQYTNIIYQKN